jgi:hypothetical protein
MPSDTATVLNSIGVPPAARMPLSSPSPTGDEVKVARHHHPGVGDPIKGLARSASVRPIALNMARAGGAIRTVGDGTAAMLQIHEPLAATISLLSSEGGARRPGDFAARWQPRIYGS